MLTVDGTDKLLPVICQRTDPSLTSLAFSPQWEDLENRCCCLSREGEGGLQRGLINLDLSRALGAGKHHGQTGRLRPGPPHCITG